MTPTVGRIVHYKLVEPDVWAPAIITFIRDDGSVDLTVFAPPFLPNHDQLNRQTRVHEGGNLYEWRWPPRD